MSSPGNNNGDEDTWFRPVWETEDEPDPPGKVRSRAGGLPSAEPTYVHPLLNPLAQAQDAVARLEAGVKAAPDAVASGLTARLAYREASGWLAYSHVWIHPWDLALRDAHATGSYYPAMVSGHLAAQLPATTAQGSDFEAVPSDLIVNRALRYAQLWRRLSETHSWKPLAGATDLEDALQPITEAPIHDRDVDDWLTSEILEGQGPPLIRAARGARDWMNRPQVTQPLTLDGIFLAACLWRQSGFGRPVSLPFWLAAEQYLNRLALRTGIEWVAEFLGCVAAAAKIALADLDRLQTTAAKGAGLPATARSHLPAAFDLMVREPIATARGLARKLHITPQAALGLLRQLTAAGLVREATGRASFRAFVLAV